MVMRGDGGATDLSGFRRAPARTLYSGPGRVGRRRAAVEPHRGRGHRRGRRHVDQRRRDPARPPRALLRAGRQPRDRDPRPRRPRARCRRRLDAARRAATASTASARAARTSRACRTRASCTAAEFAGATTELHRAARRRPRRLPGRAAAPTASAVALTNTCAANALGIVEPGDYAHGDGDAARAAFAVAGAHVAPRAGRSRPAHAAGVDAGDRRPRRAQ